MGRPKPIQIFYPGNHIDYHGQKVPVSKSALADTVDYFNSSGAKIPLVVGHPATNDESFGYASRLSIDDRGRVAVAEYEGLSPAFASIVNKVGSKISAKLRLPGNPANKSQGIEFDHIGFFFGGDKVALDQLPTASFSRDKFTSYIRCKKMDEEELIAREAAIAAKEAEFAAKEAAFAAQAAVAPVVAELVAGGHVAPVDQANIAAIFASVQGNKELTASFAAGKESAVSALARILKTPRIPLGVELDPSDEDGDEDSEEELAVAHFSAPSGDLDNESAKMDMKIRGHMKKTGLGYGAARKAVMKMGDMKMGAA